MKRQRTSHKDTLNEDIPFNEKFVSNTSNKKICKEVDHIPCNPNVASTFRNEYKGFQVPDDKYQIPRISIKTLTPELFFATYIATRTPVVIEGLINDKEFKAAEKWTNTYLSEVAGNEILSIEKRLNDTEKFGQGQEVSMAFKSFLDLISTGDELHYLTTQNVEPVDRNVLNDEDNQDAGDDGDVEGIGRQDIMAPFMKHLATDFPLRPSLMGNLIPQNINVWMGNNKTGSSSGLHHDYHDNLYLLLRGRKKFRLYSPADAEAMYTTGKLLKVHANGRVNHEGEETTSDGRDLLSEAALQASQEKIAAEKELMLCEADAESGLEGSHERLKAAEERLENAINAVLRVECGGHISESENEDGPFHFEDESEGESDNEVIEKDYDLHEEMDINDDEIADQTLQNPLNFSQIDTRELDSDASCAKLYERYPCFRTAKAAFCELNKGDMLYLPASWFHEVTSFPASPIETSSDTPGHLALNYWYHPPDQLNSFEAPYISSFWSQDWAARQLYAASKNV